MKVTYIGHATLLLEIGATFGFSPIRTSIASSAEFCRACLAPGIALDGAAAARRDSAHARARRSSVVRLARRAAARHSALRAAGDREVASTPRLSTRGRSRAGPQRFASDDVDDPRGDGDASRQSLRLRSLAQRREHVPARRRQRNVLLRRRHGARRRTRTSSSSA